MTERYETFVGFRYLRSRGGQGFVSFISTMSMLGIALGVAVLIVVLSVMNGFEDELRDRILAMTAHATIIGDERGLSGWPGAVERVEADQRVLSAAPYVDGEAMLVTENEVSGALIRGVLPELESKVSGIDRLVQNGGVDQLEAGAFRIILGKDLAEFLSVGPGDRVVMVVSRGSVTPAGVMPRMRRFEVSGIFSAGMYEYDRNQAFIHMEDAARLYRMGDKVSGVRISIDNPLNAPEVVRDVAGELDDAMFISDWTRRHTNFFRSIQITKTMMFAILLMVMAVAAFNIVSTLVMVVRDKQADISILRTMGAYSRSVMRIFMVQGTMIGIVGTLSGILLGVLIALNLETLVAGLERLLDTDLLAADVYYIGDLPARIQVMDIVRIGGTALVLSFLSTLYPAWRAARVQPAEVLRYE